MRDNPAFRPVRCPYCSASLRPASIYAHCVHKHYDEAKAEARTTGFVAGGVPSGEQRDEPSG